MTNFSVRKLDNQFYVSFRNGIANVSSSDINFPESFYRWNSDVTFDLKIDQNARDSLMKVAANYGLARMLYDPDKFLYPTVLTDAEIIALGQNPGTWKQTYTPVELKISYKDSNNIVQKYSTNNVEARVKGFGSFLPYNRKMPLRIQSSTPIDGFGTTTEVTLNNMIQDGSNINEHIIYKIFRDYGMPAPRTNFIRLFINDTTVKITSIQNNLITTNGNHYLFEGMRIKFVDLDGISNDSIFYVISSGRTDTSFKVSSTLNGSAYALQNLTSVNIEYYTDYGEYLNVENLRNTYRLNELFGAGQTKSLYEVNVTAFNKELTIPTTDPYYDRDIGSGDRSDLHNFLTQLGSTSNWYNNISSCIDVDQFIKFTVIELLLAQDDGYNSFLNNSYLHSDINNKFRIIPWGSDTYFNVCLLNSAAWTYYSRWAQQCFANKITIDKFVIELVKFKNWLKNDSNIISYINNIFNEKISDFTSDQKKPNSENLTSLTTAKNRILSYINNGVDQETSTFLRRPYPVTNFTGQTIGDNFVLSWDPVDKNVNGETINDVSYEIVFLGAQDHKYRWGGFGSSNFSNGMQTSSTTYSLSSSTINILYDLIANDMDTDDLRSLWGGLYLSVVTKRADGTWGFATQPILAKVRVPDAPPAPYTPSMKVSITEAMSNSSATYGLSSAPDWFEITNFDTSGINISGWRMDDDSNDVLQSIPLLPSGWNILATGESAVFIETSNPSVAIPNFRSFWNLPPSTKIGSYNGSKVGLSASGDNINLFVPSGNSSTSFVRLTGVVFGIATTNRSFYWQYENNNISLTGLSEPNSRGAYVGSGGSPTVYATGSPGIYSSPYIPNMNIAITEVMSDHGLNYGAYNVDWFEITNFDSSGISISGWRVDNGVGVDSSPRTNFGATLIPSGWTILNSGESAVFVSLYPTVIDDIIVGTIVSPDVLLSGFRSAWSLGESAKLGYYIASGGTFVAPNFQVNLSVPSGTSTTSFVKLTGVSSVDPATSLGVATSGRSIFFEYNNKIMINSGLSTPTIKGAYIGYESQTPHAVYATGSPGVYITGACGSGPNYTYTSCYNVSPLYDTTEPWNPTYCESQYSHIKYLPKNNYLLKQSVDPPSGSYDLLCSETYPISISNKIKITIPDDPIFSGTYVFDYSPGQGDDLLSSPNWVLNEAESSHSLVPYSHSDSAFNGKTLVSFMDDSNDFNNYNYKGYLELKTRYYNDENNNAARFLEDAYAFPADFVFTAVQPPCPCTGIPGVDFVSTIGSGHRLAVGFVHPIRWRHPYKNWVLVDRIFHTIENSIPDYTIGSVVNIGNQSYYSPDQQQTVYLNNSKYVNYAESYVPGTAETSIGTGLIGISLIESWPKCTGVPDLGFAFRSSASGLGIDRGLGLVADQFDMQGLGRHQEYIRDVVNNFDFIIKDERPFFENKIPVRSIVEFVYSCRSGLSCSSFSNINPSTVSITSGLFYGCGFANVIGTDYLCGPDAQVYPDNSYWINNNITSTDIIYSGGTGIPFQYSASDRVLPVFDHSISDGNNIVQIYDYNPASVDNAILIRTTGGTPTNIRDFVRSNLFAHRVISKPPFTYYEYNSVFKSKYNKWDLYWTVDTDNGTAKVYIIPDIEEIPYPTIFITGAGFSDVNGTYTYNSNAGYDEYALNDLTGFENTTYFNNPMFFGNIFTKNDAEGRFRIGLAATGNPYRWVIQKSIENNWINYYYNTGVSGVFNIIQYTNNSRIPIINNQWLTSSPCYAGINPPPTSIAYYYR